MEKRNKFLKKYSNIIIFTMAILVFVTIAIMVLNKSILTFDNYIYTNISKLISDTVTIIMKIFTSFGSIIILNLICAISFIIYKNKKYAKYLFLNLLVIAGLNLILKNIFIRPRPQILQIVKERGFSFPSGHSMVSMAFYGFIIYLIYKNVKNPYLKWSIISGLIITILLIGFSRIYLGVHYASDVIGGFCFSIAYIYIYTRFYKKVTSNQNQISKNKI